MVVANLDKVVPLLVSCLAWCQKCDLSHSSVSSLSRGLWLWNSAIRSVLKTSNPVTFASTEERVSARCREVPF